MTDRRSRDQEELERRLEVLRLPVTPLRRVGGLARPLDAAWERQPECVGMGPDERAYVVRRSRDDPHRCVVTVHDGGRRPVREVSLRGDEDGPLRASFVQPLPGDRILLVGGRNDRGPNAEIYTADGTLERRADLGDAIEHVLTTPEGAIWVGYFDEAMASDGPGAHGLARFNDTLTVAWRYPFDAGLPVIFDCYALTLTGETAWHCAYTDFHLGSVRGDRATDLGEAPRHSAKDLLVDGRHGALISGPGHDYDLVTPFRLTPDGVVAHGAERRLVLPDGAELHGVRLFARGSALHVFGRNTWWQLDLENLLDA